MIEGVKNRILNRNFILNSVVVGAGATIGAVLGVEKNKLNKDDLEIILNKEYCNCLEQIKTNNATIDNGLKLMQENKILRDTFNAKCAKGYELLKRANKINIALGILIGAGVGILGVILKSKILKGKNNENNPDNKQLLNVQS